MTEVTEQAQHNTQMIYKKKAQKNKENIFKLTVQNLEKYSTIVQQLAHGSWHWVNSQEELLTGEGRGGGRW